MSVPAGTMSSNSFQHNHIRPKDPNKRLQKGQYETSVPTVADRVAQTVVAMELEKRVEPMFHPDSYGYRPNRSALDAVGTCRKRCWEYDWGAPG
jgi:RNA-directed DNA polymerase